MFISKTSLIHRYVSKGLVVLVTSCKVYELWILTKIIEYLRKRGVSPRVVSYDDICVEFKANDIEIIYNKPLAEQVFIDKLTGSRLRSDFVIKHGDVVVVYDAKYKRKLSKEDADSMSTYIIELSGPISSLNNMTLVGGFYKLRRDGSQDESPLCGVIESKGTNAINNICIEVNSLDPRESDNVVEQILENSLRNYLHV